MKNSILTIIALLVIELSVSAQRGLESVAEWKTKKEPIELSYNVSEKYQRPVLKSTLTKAQQVSDLMEDYPGNWINNYISTEIRTVAGGKLSSATGKNNTLTKEQKNLLHAADPGTAIEISVKYLYNNAVTNHPDRYELRVTLNILPTGIWIPAVGAEFSGGHPQMRDYFKLGAVQKFIEANEVNYQNAKVGFTINENGEVTGEKILSTSGNSSFDKEILKAIKNMPAWKPAENSNGKKIIQEFIFTIGNGGC